MNRSDGDGGLGFGQQAGGVGPALPGDNESRQVQRARIESFGWIASSALNSFSALSRLFC